MQTNMKLEAFVDMATKLKEQKPLYKSCICSPKTYQEIKKFGVYGRMFLGIKIFEEIYWPDDRVWCLDKDNTNIYCKKRLAGLIAHLVDIKKLSELKSKCCGAVVAYEHGDYYVPWDTGGTPICQKCNKPCKLEEKTKEVIKNERIKE